MENIHLPDWFLVLSLFLPRIALIAAFFTDGSFPHLMPKWLSVPMAFVIPRILILIAVVSTLGIGVWFWIHLIALFIAWGWNILNASANVEKLQKLTSN
jgi:hypothetical protein